MKKIILSALMLAGTLTFAQDGKLTVSGSVDAYGTLNSEGGASTGILSDVGANGFGLGMANTVFSYEAGKAGAVADLAFGPRANAANVYANGSDAGAINQLYAYYNASEKVTLTLGQFNTFYGYEVISPASNFNYSVSHLFNAGPFSHTGAKVDYAASEDWSFMLAVTNPHTLLAGTNNSSKIQLGGQVGFKGQFLNLIYGSVDGSTSDEFLIDVTGGFDVTEKFYIGYNAAYQEGVYGGAALYLQGQVNETLSIGLRPEYIDTTSVDGTGLFAATLTANKTITNNLKGIVEVRYDQEELSANGKDDVALTVAAVYSF